MKANNHTGFTLVELLVVISIIGILASLLTSAALSGKHKAQGVQCLNNGQQISRALQLYAGDYEDWIPPNPENGHTNAWVRGSMNIPYEATNSSFLTDARYAKLAPYSRNESRIYRCPADKSSVRLAGRKYARVRSFSMNQAVGTKSTSPRSATDAVWLDGTRMHQKDKPFRTYGRFSEMVQPNPSELWIFLDENEHLINDAAFAVSMIDPEAIIDWPGTYHNYSAGFSFGDGHSEIHKWLDRRTRLPAQLLWNDIPAYTSAKVQPGNRDIHWLRLRTSALALP